jgi:hypothetical protein
MVWVFSNQKSQFWYILEGFGIENVDIFYGHFGIFDCHLVLVTYGHLVYLMAVWYSFWSFGRLFPFWNVATK